VIGITISVGPGHLAYSKVKLRAVMRAAGGEVAAVARQLVRRSAGSGRVYRLKGGGKYQASGSGSAPVSKSGLLAGSIVARPFKDGEGVVIRDTAFYSLMLEGGAKGGVGSGRKDAKGKRNVRRRGRLIQLVGRRVLAPRPFLTVALAAREESIARRVRLSLNEDIKFVRMRA
jgi:hypothetical protein